MYTYHESSYIIAILNIEQKSVQYPNKNLFLNASLLLKVKCVRIIYATMMSLVLGKKNEKTSTTERLIRHCHLSTKQVIE